VEDWQAQPRKEPKILIIQCLQGVDTKCGGTADRLKPMLYLLRKAAEMKRFLVIDWTKPCRLEEFLVPPKGGMVGGANDDGIISPSFRWP
jgi:hypothetical protein